MTAVVIALGQRFAGDDAVGPAVAALLSGAPGLRVIEVATTADLVEALPAGSEAIVVDAVMGAGEPGTVRVLAPEDLERDALAAVSSHGLDLAAAVRLSQVLHPDAPPRVRIVGVVVTTAPRFHEGLSPAVASAVPRAAAAVLGLVAKEAEPPPDPSSIGPCRRVENRP